MEISCEAISAQCRLIDGNILKRISIAIRIHVGCQNRHRIVNETVYVSVLFSGIYLPKDPKFKKKKMHFSKASQPFGDGCIKINTLCF